MAKAYLSRDLIILSDFLSPNLFNFSSLIIIQKLIHAKKQKQWCGVGDLLYLAPSMKFKLLINTEIAQINATLKFKSLKSIMIYPAHKC